MQPQTVPSLTIPAAIVIQRTFCRQHTAYRVVIGGTICIFPAAPRPTRHCYPQHNSGCNRGIAARHLVVIQRTICRAGVSHRTPKACCNGPHISPAGLLPDRRRGSCYRRHIFQRLPLPVYIVRHGTFSLPAVGFLSARSRLLFTAQFDPAAAQRKISAFCTQDCYSAHISAHLSFVFLSLYRLLILLSLRLLLKAQFYGRAQLLPPGFFAARVVIRSTFRWKLCPARPRALSLIHI